MKKFIILIIVMASMASALCSQEEKTLKRNIRVAKGVVAFTCAGYTTAFVFCHTKSLGLSAAIGGATLLAFKAGGDRIPDETLQIYAKTLSAYARYQAREWLGKIKKEK